MKRLIILLIACVAVLGNISAQNEHSARRAAKLHQDSLVNYEIWLKDIASICLNAQEDLKANKRAWKNPHDSRAEIFVRQLENCKYYHRADKDWSVPYIEDIIQRAISRIRAYKTPQSAPMKFDDIIPADFLSQKPKVETQNVQQAESTPTEDMLEKINATHSWLKDIARICVSAQEDLKANRRAWKNPNDSRAEIFVRRLEDCSYFHRADKEWSVPYIEEIIQKCISRIRAYKTTQQVPMEFDDIIPAEFLPEKPKAEAQNVQ